MRARIVALCCGAFAVACGAQSEPDPQGANDSTSTAPSDSGDDDPGTTNPGTSTGETPSDSSSSDGSSSDGGVGTESSTSHGEAVDTSSTGTESTGEPAGPSFAEDIYPIIQNSTCLNQGCHGQSPGAAGLFMPDADAAYADLVDVPASSAGFAIDRVEPGDAAASYLPMFAVAALVPAGALTNGDVAAIDAWIDAGALP